MKNVTFLAGRRQNNGKRNVWRAITAAEKGWVQQAGSGGSWFFRRFKAKLKQHALFLQLEARGRSTCPTIIYIRRYNIQQQQSQGGRPASTRTGTHNSMAGQYGQCRTLGTSFRRWVFPLPATQPNFVRSPPAEDHPGGLKITAVRSDKAVRVVTLRADRDGRRT